MTIEAQYIAGASTSPLLFSITAADHKSDTIYDASALSRKRSRATIAATDNLLLAPHQLCIYPGTPPAEFSMSAEEMILRHSNIEMDACIRLHVNSLTRSLEEAQRRQSAALLAAAEQQAAKRMRATEAQLERIRQRNAELEEQLKQAARENQLLFHVAKNNEAMACNLRASLDEAIRRTTATVTSVAHMEEGYGDNEEVLSSSATGGGECSRRRRNFCRTCGEKEAGVVMLPCRHLCRCTACEVKQKQIQRCPVCSSVINATIQVLSSFE